MKRVVLIAIACAALAGVSAQSTESTELIDAAAISKIRDEGMNRSQAMDTLFWLSDAKGPRLNGSPAFEDAGDWAVKKLVEWGVSNVHKERWPFGKGWSLTSFHATMTEPQVMPIIGYPKAWSQGTNGTITAEVVRAVIATEADAKKYKGQLKGKIVLTQPAREVRMLEFGDGPVLRYDDKDGKWAKEALTMPPAKAGRADAPGGGAGAAGATGGADSGRGGSGDRFNVNQFYKDEGVLALLDRGSNADLSAGGSDLTWQQQKIDGGTIFVQGASPRDGTALPQITLAVEHYNRMVRLIDHQISVKMELNVGVKWTDEPAGGGGFNIVGDIPGTDPALKDQIVMLGAHFDSWHGATGATDNGTGSAAMMEVMRIIKTLGLKPRRTIRIGLWGGEEEGELGSKNYAAAHLGTKTAPKPERAKTVAYFNLDNGTGKIRGVWLQGNAAAGRIFKQWSAPLKDLGVDIFGPRSVSQTDHSTFDALGIPAFQFVQERLEYNARTHHTNMDFYDRVQAADVMQQAVVCTVFVWQSANRPQPLPRK